MHESLEQLLLLARQVWQRRWLCLAVAWPLAVLGWLAVVLLPSKYESSAQIFADAETLLAPLLKDITVEPELAGQAEVMQRTLLSRPILTQVIEQTPLRRRFTGPAAIERAVSALASEIRVTAAGPNLFSVAYRDRDPATASAVVQRLLELFIASNLGASRKEIEAAGRFIDEQIGVQERALEAAERRLAEFQKENVDFLPGEKGYFGRLQQARAEATAARADLEAAKARRDELRRQLTEVPASGGPAQMPGFGMAAPPPDSPAGQLAALERRLAELRNRYTPRHPDVLATERAIATLRRQLGSGTGSPVLPNPVHEQIRFQLVQLEGEIASLEDRLAKADHLVEELSGLARVMPEADAGYKRLARDYEVIKRNYEELVARRESVRIADDLTRRPDQMVFRIIDPPEPALLPAAPPRLPLLAAVLLGSLGAGIGLALARILVARPFGSVRELQLSYGLPVLGVISEVATRAGRARQRRERLAFTAGATALLLVFVGVGLAERFRLTTPLRSAVHLHLTGESAT